MAKTKSTKLRKEIESEKLTDGLYKLDTKKPLDEAKHSKTIYTILGKNDSIEDSFPILTKENAEQNEDAFAMRCSVNNQEFYYVKIDARSNLYNPISPEPNTNSRKFRLMSNKDNLWQFIQVKKECFYHYLEFLKSSNILHLKFAERARI